MRVYRSGDFAPCDASAIRACLMGAKHPGVLSIKSLLIGFCLAVVGSVFFYTFLMILCRTSVERAGLESVPSIGCSKYGDLDVYIFHTESSAFPKLLVTWHHARPPQ